jgi:hypothetical protein
MSESENYIFHIWNAKQQSSWILRKWKKNVNSKLFSLVPLFPFLKPTTMKNNIHWNHTTLQLKLQKNSSITIVQLSP